MKVLCWSDSQKTHCTPSIVLRRLIFFTLLHSWESIIESTSHFLCRELERMQIWICVVPKQNWSRHNPQRRTKKTIYILFLHSRGIKVSQGKKWYLWRDVKRTLCSHDFNFRTDFAGKKIIAPCRYDTPTSCHVYNHRAVRHQRFIGKNI